MRRDPSPDNPTMTDTERRYMAEFCERLMKEGIDGRQERDAVSRTTCLTDLARAIEKRCNSLCPFLVRRSRAKRHPERHARLRESQRPGRRKISNELAVGTTESGARNLLSSPSSLARKLRSNSRSLAMQNP